MRAAREGVEFEEASRIQISRVTRGTPVKTRANEDARGGVDGGRRNLNSQQQAQPPTFI